MNGKINPSNLNGKINPPLSKSHLHRYLLIILVTKNKAKLMIDDSTYLMEDVQATLNLLKNFNCKIEYNEKNLIVDATGKLFYSGNTIDCYSCATTLRMGQLIALYYNENIKFKVSEGLFQRPLTFLENLYEENGIKYIKNKRKIQINGNIKNIFKKNLIIKNCESSQYISSLIILIPFINPKIELDFENGLKSTSYLELTKEILKEFQIEYEFIYSESNELKNIKYLNEIPVENIQKQKDISIPYDYSSLAFWIIANQINSNNKIEFLENQKFTSNNHPDYNIYNIYQNEIIDLKNNPDLFPILFINGLFSKKRVVFINYESNKIKESNRVEAMLSNIKELGLNIQEINHQIILEPKQYQNLKFGKIKGYNDHRIVMAFAILGSAGTEGVEISEIEAVNKSYVNFWKDFEQLGGKIEY